MSRQRDVETQLPAPAEARNRNEDSGLRLADLLAIVRVHAQIKAGLEFQTTANVELKIEHDFAVLDEIQPLEKDACSEARRLAAFSSRPRNR
jgi:hypothetical protein